ncbi:alpha/beta hydrolase [Scandinavium sp. H11S7]|uniref:alpha/beta hydrolase n=1 Tax=Scandinavium hiltneri TaxID=2926519 RepID=UPI002166A613|nr:alpha/beta hydrolase [Scandinavium hiltneri]MCS2159017.1 alpha/beta hydrolase [Scandinavium hiltneri]
MSHEQREEIKMKLGLPAVAASSDRSIEQIRAGFAAFMKTMRIPSGTLVSNTTLGGQRALIVERETDKRAGTILYFHGGSFLMGSPETGMALTASLVVRTGIRSISLDYRLAPEHPFPAAIEDCTAAYRELLEQGVDPASIVFAGDSAGGGLCITTCLKARSEGLPLPAAILTFSAGLDATRSGASVDTKNGIDPFFTRESFRASGGMYLADADPHQELLSPAVYANLTGFPPLLLQVGTNELLLDDSTRLAERARDAEVDVILDVTANVPHVFQGYNGVLEEADNALDRAALFIRQTIK